MVQTRQPPTLETVDERLTAVEILLHNHSERFDAIDERFDAIDRQFAAVHREFSAVHQRMDRLEAKVDLLIERLPPAA